MPEFGLGIVGWIIIGFLAGALSGMVIGRDRSPSGCLPNILIGILGGLLGGFLARQLFGTEMIIGWLGALIVAFLGAIIVRWLISATR